MTVPTITDDLIAELEAEAAKATNGPWTAESSPVGELYVSGPCDEFICGAVDHVHDANMIALLDPQTVLALLAERAELKRKSRRYDFIRDQHNYEFSDIGVSNGNLFLAREEDGELDLDSSIDELMEAMQEQPS
ncbi:hypothetical protein [Pseudomonas sp. S9]|uniref:hypothetical protein n=1 Tax=Pseudomonas sp. S9 TaxID=686578 RepID=UPI0002556DD2|nr:hypothetical protein [Pseudomonas sp. S9]